MTSEISTFDLTSVYNKVSPVDGDTIIEQLHEKLDMQDFAWISFVYFASLEMGGWYAQAEDPKYREALKKSDYILADGIAFRLLHYAFFHPNTARWKILFWYKSYSKLAVENLNGTDFIPKLLRSFAGQPVRVVLYGSTSANLPRAVDFVRSEFELSVEWAHGYAPFPMELLSSDIPTILLVWLGTPKQEQWILERQEIFQKRGSILVFGVGGLFDFWGGLEKRAPSLFRMLNIEWLWRLISFPQKNFRKVVSSFKFFRYIFLR